MGVTRRQFLSQVGQAGGYSAAFVAMQGLGLMPARAARTSTLQAAQLRPGFLRGHPRRRHRRPGRRL